MQFTDSKNSLAISTSFYKDLEFSDKSVVITSMLENDFGKEIRIAFKEGQVMKEHKTKFPITVMTLKGCIEFCIGDDMYELCTGDMIALEGNIMHELKATRESVVRLSLHKSDTVQRVERVLKI